MKVSNSPWLLHYDGSSCNGCDIEVLACLTPVYDKVVVAVGICACNGGIFKECYNIIGGVDTIIPVDIYVPGCAARPEAIIDGVVKAVALLDEKKKKMAEEKKLEKAGREGAK